MRYSAVKYLVVGLLLFFVSFGVFAAESLSLEMVFVSGGTFWMGSNEAAYKSTELPYQAEVSSFFISETEITQELWTSVMGTNPSRFKNPSKPVETVSWLDAVKFCNALSEKEGLNNAYTISGSRVSCDWSANGYRLPTETEWEYAARGGSKKAAQEETLSRAYYSGSQNPSEVAWFDTNSNQETKAVKSKAPNELGLYDMSGNVWEWCWDWMGAYPKELTKDPKGLQNGSIKVLRGGSWFTPVNLSRVTYRFWNAQSFKANSVGFRIARNSSNSY
jgi:formylglycine-generating enzyme required for sulfatase activity